MDAIATRCHAPRKNSCLICFTELQPLEAESPASFEATRRERFQLGRRRIPARGRFQRVSRKRRGQIMCSLATTGSECQAHRPRERGIDRESSWEHAYARAICSLGVPQSRTGRYNMAATFKAAPLAAGSIQTDPTTSVFFHCWIKRSGHQAR
jgi:hypothetical protein